MVSNEFVRDGRLSFHARGVGLWLLSHTAGWECTTERIAIEAGVGRDQIRRALRELEAASYLRRTRERLEGGKLGPMVYEVQCVPFENESAGEDQRLDSQALVGQALADNQHKKTHSKKTTEEDQPSGGSDADAPSAPGPDPSPEEDMPRTVAPDQPGLFDAPVVEKPRAPRKEPKLPEGAAAVVAGFVESYEQSHGGTRPLRSDIGRVAAAAKLILRNGEATLEHLVSCARKMGHGPYANLYQELKFSRPSTHGAVPRAVLHGDPRWDDVHTSIHLDEATLNAPVEAWA